MSVGRLFRASVRLCVCASVLSCTDPRPRIAAPTVDRLVSSSLRITSPGSMPLAIYAYDPQGLDQVLVTIRSGHPTLDGDTTLVFTEQNEQTLNLVWPVPAGIAAGTGITLAAKVKNVIGFETSDTLRFTVQP